MRTRLSWSVAVFDDDADADTAVTVGGRVDDSSKEALLLLSVTSTCSTS